MSPSVDVRQASRTLRDLKSGESATVRQITHFGSTGQRLLSLGLIPGCRLKFLRPAPLGDPLMVEIPGCVVCLRRQEAFLVELESVDALAA